MRRAILPAISALITLSAACGMLGRSGEVDARDGQLVRHAEGVTYRGKLYTGVVVSRYDSGQVREQERFKDGTLDGEQLTYHRNGALAARRYFKLGALDGVQRGWYPDGKRRFETHAIAGVYHGTNTHWFPSGAVSEIFEFEHGKEVGFKKWRASGQIYANVVFRDGRHYGPKGDKPCLSVEEGGTDEN